VLTELGGRLFVFDKWAKQDTNLHFGLVTTTTELQLHLSDPLGSGESAPYVGWMRFEDHPEGQSVPEFKLRGCLAIVSTCKLLFWDLPRHSDAVVVFHAVSPRNTRLFRGTWVR